MLKRIYIFSGLGVDHRVFRHINLSDFNPIFIKWIQPHKNESIEDYAKRISEQICTINPVLIGLSFGGMMAVEVAKHISTEKVIIISSAKTQQEIPFYYRISGRLKLHKLLPVSVLKSPNTMSNWMFGTEMDTDKLLLAQILEDTDPVFLSWAIDKIVSWSNQTIPNSLLHIHGTSDRILPYRYVKADFAINKGGHFMVVNKASEVTELIRKLI